MSKIKKLQYSLKNEEFDSDLLMYAMEGGEDEINTIADINQVHSVEHLRKVLQDSEVGYRYLGLTSQVEMSLKKDKIQNFFFSIQELVEFNFDTERVEDSLSRVSQAPAEDKAKKQNMVKPAELKRVEP